MYFCFFLLIRLCCKNYSILCGFYRRRELRGKREFGQAKQEFCGDTSSPFFSWRRALDLSACLKICDLILCTVK